MAGVTERTAPEVIHIHEDDWGLRTLRPLAARGEVAADIVRSVAAGERNWDGSGYRAMHVIVGPSVTYAKVGLGLADAVAAVEAHLPRVRRFYATASAGFEPGVHDSWGSYEEDAWAFGLGEDCYLHLQASEGQVTDIFYDFCSEAPAAAGRLKAAMAALDRLAPCVIADYVEHCEVVVGDAKALDRYFEEVSASATARREAYERWLAENEP